HGKSPQLSPGQVSLLVISGIVVFVALFFLAFLLLQLRSRLGGSSIYDRRLVEEKAARPAYRVRLRLFVFSARPDQMVAINRPSWRALGQCLFLWPPDTSSWLQSYRSWCAASRQHALEWEARVQV